MVSKKQITLICHIFLVFQVLRGFKMIRGKFKIVLIKASLLVIVIYTIKTNINYIRKTYCIEKQNLYTQTVLISQSRTERLVHEVDCRRIIEGDELEISYALDVLENGDYNCSSNDVLEITLKTVNCF